MARRLMPLSSTLLAAVALVASPVAGAATPEAAGAVAEEIAPVEPPPSDAAGEIIDHSVLSEDASPAAPVDAEALAEGEAAPPMWRLSDADSEVIILATLPAAPNDVDWRTRALLEAVDGAEVMWFEAELDTPAARESAMQTILATGSNPEGISLRALLAAEDAARLANVAATFGIDPAQLETLRPWHAFLMLNVRSLMREGFDPSTAIGAALLSEARARGRALGFFESAEEQLALFTGLSSDEEAALLSSSLQRWTSAGGAHAASIDAWRRGDEAALHAALNAPLRDAAPAVYEALVVERNRRWAEKMEEILAGPGDAFIAVGAAHLVGDQSAPALLREKGVAVERYGVDGSD